MGKVFLFIALSGLLLLPCWSKGQGCSDAGICSIVPAQNANSDSLMHKIGIAQSLEGGEQFTLITSTLINVSVQVLPSFQMEARMPFTQIYGDLGNVQGAGDLTVSLNKRFSVRDQMALVFSVGGKIPTNAADRKMNGLPLPMPYQTSLGTTDLLMGAGLQWQDWQFSGGYQHPFAANENGFLPAAWTVNEAALDYFESNLLQRGDDVFFRVEKKISAGNKRFSIAVLPIYRLQKDVVTTELGRKALANSSGLTVNWNAKMELPLSKRWHWQLSWANPLWWRKVRSDGLTRFFVLSNRITFLF